jgi:hypothetical protein
MAGVEAAAVGIFGARVDFDDRLDGGEAGLARIAAVGQYPIDVVRGGIEPRLDAAVPLLNVRVRRADQEWR